MDKKMKQVVRNARIWLNKYHVLLVCILSVAHIGLSCIHTRDSGTAVLENGGNKRNLESQYG